MEITLKIIGSGAQCNYVLDIIDTNKYFKTFLFDNIFIYDDNKSRVGNIKNTILYNGLVVRSLEELNILPYDVFIFCNGNNENKENLFKKFKIHEINCLNFFHEKSIISPKVYIYNGNIINAGAVIQSNVIIGNGCMIHSNSVIEHDCEIGNFVNIAPGAIICGVCKIGDRSYIYSNSTILPGIEIGKDCIIGAGSIILKDVPDNTTVIGVWK